ncbi:Mitochondrial uncoupling protein 4 [Camelus dromedarius]|uniref:Mitochondrial uncoupling protein 4 n=1 Tax=Camelus dromedarius TaxID=9838 RepID=A0A5N4CR41_CAMDR|nr:Mitochondrial uncoupling protein 4 [Camelus dromedarius]
MSAPEDEERLLPLTQRWPRASKFLLSGCAATVAELGTRPPSLGLPRESSRGRAGVGDPAGGLVSRKSVIGGMMAGVVGQFLANPTDLVKVQMQMEGKRKLEGKPLRFRGVHHAFAKIFTEGGIRGLWAGWVPNIQRAALVNMGDLTTYDTVKHYLVLNTPLEDNIMTHGLSSLCSGLVASILGTPADVIKSRIMNQPRDKQGR